MGDVEIILHHDAPKGAIIIEGFQGVGLVGTLAAQYLAEKMNAKLIGYVNSSLLPPMALLVKGEIRPPIKIYSFKKGSQDFILFESELPIPHKVISRIAREIAKFAKKNKVSEILCLEGISVPQIPSTKGVYYIVAHGNKFNFLKKNLKNIGTGIIVGVSAALLLESKINKIPAACIMAEAHSEYPDGMAAADLINLLNKMYKFNIDTAPLEKESKQFEDKLMSIIDKAKKISKDVESPKKYIG